MNFCSLCGYHFRKTADTPIHFEQYPDRGYLADDIAQFVGPNHNTYLRNSSVYLKDMSPSNWAAAVFPTAGWPIAACSARLVIFSLILNAFSGIVSYLILTLFQSLGTQISDSTYLQLEHVFHGTHCLCRPHCRPHR